MSENVTKAESLHSHEDADSSRYDVSKRMNTIIDLYVPISLCVFLGLIIEVYLDPFSWIASQINSFLYDTEEARRHAAMTRYSGNADSLPSLWKLLIFGGIFLAFIIVFTVLIVFCYVKGYKKWLEYFFIGHIFFTFFITGSTIISAAFYYINMPIDIISLFLIYMNFSACAAICVNGYGPAKMRQFFHILLGVMIALVMASFLPEWCIWTVLFLISIWDLVAVLWTYGPLNILVKTAHKRNEDLFNALVYSCMATMEENAKNNKEVESKSKDIKKIEGEKPIDKKEMKVPSKELSYYSEDDEKGSSAKLGMGDFVFYTLFLVHVRKYNDPRSFVTCFVTVLTGLTMTVFILIYFKRALPALPLSIFGGIAVFFGTFYLVSPFYTQLADNSIII
uniref:Presenilin n=1 Tax=Parastrongyloides trichosuri TaxID=131310 RepID=A0A0N4ZSK9_PARTI